MSLVAAGAGRGKAPGGLREGGSWGEGQGETGLGGSVGVRSTSLSLGSLVEGVPVPSGRALLPGLHSADVPMRQPCHRNQRFRLRFAHKRVDHAPI